ncbi:hypothetical protein [Streptomyces sparsogenes]|uniref:Uncharacterized protein n=1 Tax=Streptomyces sparsogenes DSM 40356 TaxID=1331668 RepID=A0A1R1S5L0_9ACTN|nr:hypothetical protein [Streptomyces sparsogenes]OMI33591.1 hypothetical protein SPAR_40672 [Streptomyces sparsogenes DSM 40356]
MRGFLTAAARWAAPTVVLAQVCLVWTGVFSLGEAVAVGLLLELLLAGIVITEIALARRAFTASRSRGADGQEALNHALAAVLPAPVAKAMGMEFGLLRALWRWARRRTDAPDGHAALPYGSAIKPIMWVMVALVPLEVLAVEFLVPWPVARIVLLVLSGYGTVWVLGFIAALSIRPHTVGDGKMVLRFAHFTQITIPLELVASVREARHGGYRRAVQIDDGVLAMPIGDSTTLSVTLREPYPVAPKPGRPAQEVREVRFAADSTRDAVRVLTAHIAAE